MNFQRQLLFPTNLTVQPIFSPSPVTMRLKAPITSERKPMEYPTPPGPLDAPPTSALQNDFDNISGTDSHRYSDKRRLAEGANSTVYQAVDTHLSRSVAIKNFHPEVLISKTPKQRSSLSAVARVQHSHVVSTYDLGIDTNGTFLVMEYVQGETLEAIAEKEVFDLERFLQFARQSLEGLLAIHRAGVLHLGLKSSNLMLTSHPIVALESAKIVGFSRAQIIDPIYGNIGHIIGPHSDIRCTAPEQLSCSKVNEKTDLYSLGCCLYQALTAQSPFNGKNVMQVMSAHMLSLAKPLELLRPDLPTWLIEWTMSLIANQPNNRTTVTEALETLIERTVGSSY